MSLEVIDRVDGLAAASLAGLDVAVVTARRHGTRFRPSELRHLELLSRIVAVARRRIESGVAA